jgi:predicted CXXCH cytochrome family protein
MIVRAIIVTMLVMAPIIGCDRESVADDAPRSESTVAGAAPADYLKTVAAATRPVAIAPQAPKPTGPLAPGTSCVSAECHATYSRAAHVHGPVNEKACDSCHAADVGGHRYPLKRGKTETCTFCHAVAGTASHQHAPLKDGCTTCHEPHSGPAKFLLKADNVEQLCLKCHDVPLKKFAHEPFAKGQCTLCHEPHQANNVKLLRGGEGKDHCFTCHGAMKQTFASAMVVHQPASQNCTNCHNPHSTDHPHELKAPVKDTCLTSGCHDKLKSHLAAATVKHGATDTAASCINCHNAHASAQRGLLADRQEQLCLKCHDKPVQTAEGRTVENVKPVLQSTFLHGPVRSGYCSACHDPHGAIHPALLERAFPEKFYTPFDVKKYDLCFTCHDPTVVLEKKTASLTNFRNGQSNLHYLHVNRDEKGRSCRTCHDMHGSNLTNHMASNVPFEGSNWAMPIEYRKTDTGGSCTPGCHGTKTYDRGSAATVISPTTPPPTSPTTRGAS